MSSKRKIPSSLSCSEEGCFVGGRITRPLGSSVPHCVELSEARNSMSYIDDEHNEDCQEIARMRETINLSPYIDI